MQRDFRIGIKTLVAIIAIILTLSATTAYATFDLTGGGQVTVTSPVETAIFVSGQLGNSPCTVTLQGANLSCPSAKIQAGNTTVLAFTIKNTGTVILDLDIAVTPDNASVLSVAQSTSGPTTISPNAEETYSFALFGITSGNSGFTISVTPEPLPPN